MNRYRFDRIQLVSVFVVALAVLSSGCGEEPASAPAVEAPAASAPAPAAQSSVTEGPGAIPPAGFPTEFIYEGSKHDRVATTPNELHLASTSPDAVTQVVTFYQGALPRSGFKPVTVLTPDSTTTIVTASNGPRVFSATIRAVGAGSRIELAHKLVEEM